MSEAAARVSTPTSLDLSTSPEGFPIDTMASSIEAMVWFTDSGWLSGTDSFSGISSI